MEIEVLRRIGLSESDTKVYLSLLRRGNAKVSELAADSGVHRTNIYSILDKLKEIGLVSDFKEEGGLRFKITDPENLINYLKESEEAIQSLIPNLKKIQESIKEKVDVEIFRGEKGMKSAFKDILREKKEVVGFGMTGQLRKYLPVFALQWLREIKENRIKNKYIYVKGTEIKQKDFKIKTLPQEFFTPVATQIYGDKILISIWEPVLVAILIRSKEVADNYRKHFNLLWRIAKN